VPIEQPNWLAMSKPALVVIALASLWIWETFLPLVGSRQRRWRHAARNVVIALLNTIVLAVVFSAATVGVALWAGGLPGAEERWQARHHPLEL
jgi:hypothetical protein